MVFTKFRNGIAVSLFLGITAIGAGGLFTRILATELAAAVPDKQQEGQASPALLHERAVELKQQLEQLQKKIAQLEQESQPSRSERDRCDPTVLANLFKYRIPFEIGRTQTAEGGRIEIREVWGTRPRIEVGGQYLVRGKYMLPHGEPGILHFYETATGNGGRSLTLDLQTTPVDNQEGEFALVHAMAVPGYFHLILTAKERYSRFFADVYFGTGDNVWREKP